LENYLPDYSGNWHEIRVKMESLGNFLYGLSVAIQPENILYCFIGSLLGTLIGVLPGIGPTAGVALLLPATFHLNPTSAIIMLAGMAYGAMYGGSTTSILVNVPGEASSVVTCLDGYQMARQGRAGPALGIAAFGSFIAGTLSVIGVMFLAPVLGKAALSFGAPEYCSLMIMSLVMSSYLTKGSMAKALIMMGLGLVLSTIGLDRITGRERFTYGIFILMDGIGIIPLVIGLFGVGEILNSISSSTKIEIFNKKIRGYLPSRQDWKDSLSPITRGTLLGFILGIFPGMSAMIVSFLSYGLEKKLSSHPERFGEGTIEGVAAPESCNNAAATAGFIPLLSLGIPSNAFNALLLGALMIYGLQPGPLLMKLHADLFWGVLGSMYFGNIMLLIINLPLIPMWVRLLRIPYALLAVIILVFCFIGSYSINNNINDVFVTFIFGAISVLLRNFGFEFAPLILAFVLGPLLETTFRQSMIVSEGSFFIFMSRPISAVLITITILIMALSFLKRKPKIEDNSE
jgi:putative tricarboxylic transport membrane protein